jgi:type III restriction enzyme
MTERIANAIAGRLSLRPPQRQSLDILQRITEIAPPQKNIDIDAALTAIAKEYPSVISFEREFPSLCFALATGVGKTRLMGAFIAYLHNAHGFRNFFVLAPNLTIYGKLIGDFTQNNPKYVLKGIQEFAISPPVITTGDNFERHLASGGSLFPTTINIFNISKINSEVRGGRSPKMRSFREEIGESYFDYLAGLDDLVLIMDESHRYRASAGIRAINELKPVLGLELTATPFVESTRGPIPFQNVIYDYPLRRAMEDGFVKEPAVVTRENFVSIGKSPETIQEIKLQDGVRLHESVKVELETYARNAGERIVKPFMLIIARDTTHAAELLAIIKGKDFFEGRYADKVIQVDSSTKEEETIERLLKVEHADEPTEIVIHVNMLKEGWDVTNLYTIVPLRAANARTLIEQSIGRGLRLPYGKRTGVEAVDRLNIVAHDRFQEIVDEARKPDSIVQMKTIILSDDLTPDKPKTVVSTPKLLEIFGMGSEDSHGSMQESAAPPIFKPEELKIAQIAYEEIRKLETLPSSRHLSSPEQQAKLVEAVENRWQAPQMELEGISMKPDFSSIVAKSVEAVQKQTIDIPRILVVPRGEVKSGFRAFKLDLQRMKYEAPNETLVAQHLRTGDISRIGVGQGQINEARLEDFIVSGLIDFDDVAYDDHAELLYDLAGQVVQHLSYLPEMDARKVLQVHRREIVNFIHAQMQQHYHADAHVEYDVVVKRGFTALKDSAYTENAGERMDFRMAPSDKSNMARYIFTGFKRCLYDKQKFQSDAERKLAIILDRESDKWFKPAKGQFQLFYRKGNDDVEYQPDFVSETKSGIFMLEPKASNEMDDVEVIAKKNVALKWCAHASSHAKANGGKPWTYALIPHTAIAENMTIDGLMKGYANAYDLAPATQSALNSLI